jgi:hypothetical protein
MDGWMENVHPKKGSHFGMESPFILHEAKIGYVWNMLWYTGKNTELKNEILDINILLQAAKDCIYRSCELLRQVYTFVMYNYYSSPESSDMLNGLETFSRHSEFQQARTSKTS